MHYYIVRQSNTYNLLCFIRYKRFLAANHYAYIFLHPLRLSDIYQVSKIYKRAIISFYISDLQKFSKQDRYTIHLFSLSNQPHIIFFPQGTCTCFPFCKWVRTPTIYLIHQFFQYPKDHVYKTILCSYLNRRVGLSYLTPTRYSYILYLLGFLKTLPFLHIPTSLLPYTSVNLFLTNTLLYLIKYNSSYTRA